MSVRVGWAAVGFGAGDLAVLLYVPIALPLVGAQTLGVAGSEGRATRQHRAAGGLWTRPRAIALAEHVGRAGSEGGGKCSGRTACLKVAATFTASAAYLTADYALWPQRTHTHNYGVPRPISIICD